MNCGMLSGCIVAFRSPPTDINADSYLFRQRSIRLKSDAFLKLLMSIGREMRAQFQLAYFTYNYYLSMTSSSRKCLFRLRDGASLACSSSKKVGGSSIAAF
jgi:hypothetical protein